MATIIAGNAASIPLTVAINGRAASVSGTISCSVYKMDGRAVLIEPFDLVETPDWSIGLVLVEMAADKTGALPVGDAQIVLAGSFGVKRFRLNVETLQSPTRTSLFIKDIIVEDVRNEQLMAAAAGVLQDVEISDDYIWNKIRAAESEIAHRLRVPLVPTRFFPQPPTPEQIEALDGMAWEHEVGYDYTPDMFERDKWGTIMTRQKPVISVERLTFSIPTTQENAFDIPKDWIRIDAKYGYLRIVPLTTASLITTGGMGMMALTSYKTIPSMIQLEYTAGLSNVEDTYPELIDVIKKLAVFKIVSEAFLPQSGSINADGLSQSMSVDLSKYQGAIDTVIDGPAGANGGLQAKINGIRSMVV